MTSPRVTKLVCTSATVRVAGTPALMGSPGDTELSAAAWRELCLVNPRLHDGAILNIQSFDGDSGTFFASVGRYSNLAVQGHTLTTGPHAGQTVPDLGVWLLGIKAFITASGTDGREHALILRRGADVRMYPNLWEIGPGGGVDVPTRASGGDSATLAGPGSMSLSWPDLLAALAAEAQQELGITLAESCESPELVAVYQDREARSFDVIAHCRWKTAVDPRAGWCRLAEHNWEYSDAAWLARPDAGAWMGSAKQLSPLARAVLAGWAGC